MSSSYCAAATRITIKKSMVEEEKIQLQSITRNLFVYYRVCYNNSPLDETSSILDYDTILLKVALGYILDYDTILLKVVLGDITRVSIR